MEILGNNRNIWIAVLNGTVEFCRLLQKRRPLVTVSLF